MRYHQLGRTGLKISAIGLGCGNFGGVGSAPELFGKGESEAEAHRVMDAAWDMGINLFDTANSYGGGRSESYIGSWLKSRGAAVREQIVLCTKVFSPVGPGPNDRGLSRRHILTQIDASLARLGMDHVDLYMIHAPDPETPLEETLKALDHLVRTGKVCYFGACNMPASLLMKALGISERTGLRRFDWVQNSYSLLDRGDEIEMLPLCREQGVGYTPFSPLAGGWLTGKYRCDAVYPEGSRMTLRPESYLRFESEVVFDALDALETRAAARGVDMATLALAWVMAHPAVTAPIVGPRRPEHLAPAARALEITLEPAERESLLKLFEMPGR